MLIDDLITVLEEEKERQKKYEDIFGPPTIQIDVFSVDKDHKISYRGISEDVRITSSSDGVYRILTAWID
jgi:hypothetical protein